MLGVFSYACNAILPLVLLMALGYGLRRTGLITEEFAKKGNSFVFKYCAPCQMFIPLYNASLSDIQPIFIVGQAAAVAVLMLAGLGLGKLFRFQRNRMAIIIMAMYRSNFGVIGVAIATGLMGDAAASVCSMSILFIITLFNVMAVFWFCLYSDLPGCEFNARSVGRQLLHNPLIQGITASLLCLLIRRFIPLGADGLPVFTLRYSLPFVYSAIYRLYSCCATLLLVFLGAQLKFSALGDFVRDFSVCIVSRTLAAPLIGFGVCALIFHLAGFHPTPAMYAVNVGLFCSPQAVLTSAQGAEMGADSDLAIQLIVWSSISCFVSMFVVISLLRTMGLL